LALAARRSPVFDTLRYTGDLEAAYGQMHERAVRGEAPAAFAVDRTLQS
jgi:hypothetical protein